MEAVASQLASSFQFGSGGIGRWGEVFQGKGRPPISPGPFRKQVESPDDWQCDCGYVVWARRPHCPKCSAAKREGDWVAGPGKTSATKEQEATAAGQQAPPPQE
eukprot:16440114-Heterocapsa_arctica.AAC.1